MTCTRCAGRANRPIDVGEPHPHPTHDCTTTVNHLLDTAVRSSQAFTNAVLQCCAGSTRPCGCGSTGTTAATGSAGAVGTRVVRSKPRSTQPNTKDRRVTLETPLTNGYLVIPHDRITLQPSGGRDTEFKPVGALKPNEATFHLEVEAAGIPGAVYFADVRVSALDGSPDEIIPVVIEL
ncbi:hypothetical protein [Mycolicibacterium vaccae]|uniref:hypothetical protein n=1 Tax=Mycolicibacterium vaccae TaxID=1810 RepID=UPI003D08F206